MAKVEYPSSSNKHSQLTFTYELISFLKGLGQAIPKNKHLFKKFVSKHYKKTVSDNLVEKVYEILYSSMAQLENEVIAISDDSDEEFELSRSYNKTKIQPDLETTKKLESNLKASPLIDLCNDDDDDDTRNSTVSRKRKRKAKTSQRLFKEVKKAWKSHFPVATNSSNNDVNLISKTAEIFGQIKKKGINKRDRSQSEKTSKGGKMKNKIVKESLVIRRTYEVQNTIDTPNIKSSASNDKVKVLTNSQVELNTPLNPSQVELKTPLENCIEIGVKKTNLNQISQDSIRPDHENFENRNIMKLDSSQSQTVDSPLVIESVFSLKNNNIISPENIKKEKDCKCHCTSQNKIETKTFKEIGIQCRPNDIRKSKMAYVGLQKRRKRSTPKPPNPLDSLRTDLFIDKLIEVTLPIVIQREEESKKAQNCENLD